MSSFYTPATEHSLSMPLETFVGLKSSDAVNSLSRGQAGRILGTTVAILNQTQAELDAARKQVEILKKQLAKLERVATTDLLTGLKNRRGFEDHFARELDRTRRGKSMGGVLVVIDLDSFKAINDTYGHQAGDECLKLVASTLTAEIRIMDTAARLGGDEFVLLMSDSNQDLLLTRVQNIAWKLNHLMLSWEGHDIAVNASVGMRPYYKGDKAEAIFAAADQRMYDDKKRARANRLS